jgi:hypothetical protein
LVEYLEATLLLYGEVTEVDFRVLTGKFLLGEWSLCFLSSRESPPVFLHDEKRDGLISKHRAALCSAIPRLWNRLQLLRSLLTSWRACVAKETSNGQALGDEVLGKVQEAARRINYLWSQTSDEALDVVLARLRAGVDLRDQLVSQEILDPSLQKLARDALDAIPAIDSEREFWLTVAQPELSSI